MSGAFPSLAAPQPAVGADSLAVRFGTFRPGTVPLLLVTRKYNGDPVRRHLRIIACAIGFMLPTLLPADPLNLVTNGDFETGDFTGWDATKPQYTTVVCGDSTYPAYSGNCAALWSGDTDPFAQFVDLFQLLPVTPGVSYVLNFWVDFEQSGGLFEAALGTDGSLPPSPGDCYIFLQTPTQGYVNETCSITATSSLADVFFNQGSAGNYILLDDISVTAVATPEPNTVGALLASFVGIAAVAWGRKRSLLT
jgi:hypothetical protein